MNTWTDEQLMAHADGEPVAGLDAALLTDPQLGSRVQALRAQRERVAAAFAGVLDEPVPDRLQALLAAPAPVAAPAVVDFNAERTRRRPSWAALGGMAASLLLGVLLGSRVTSPDAVGLEAGHLVARADVARALDTTLASEPRAGAVAVQLSFRDGSGRACRTFSTGEVAGLACRERDGWSVEQMERQPRTAAAGEMRQAASGLPASVLTAVDARIAGTALDAAAERAARDHGWSPR